jgi:vacuolar-type H+-ATPase subunit E/Vma4
MGYRELLQALDEEVNRQINERRRDAVRQQRQLLETARAELSARREQVLAEERRRLSEESAGALSRARLEQERAVLCDMRRQMADLRSAADARLPSMNDLDLLTRLVDEVVPELGEGALLFRVKAGDEPLLEIHLRLRHPDLLSRSAIEGSPDICGGVEVSVAGRQRFDNTLHSRLLAAWEHLEPQIAALLFRHEGTARPGPGPMRDARVETADLMGVSDGAL